MITNILEYLEQSAKRLPEKTAFATVDSNLTFAQLQTASKSAGTFFTAHTSAKKPIVFFMDKSPLCVAGFFGAVYAGCFYVLLDPKHPPQRLQTVLSVLKPDILVTNNENIDKAHSLNFNKKIVLLEDACNCEIDEAVLINIRAQHADCNPLYTNFTSGSTGVPKGVVVSHRSVINFIDNFTSIFNITENDIIGNQAPFDFDVSVKDIYSGIAKGATVQIIPRTYFSFPTKLMDFLCSRNVSVLTWAVSALCFVTTMKGLEYKTPHTITKILFSGEVMPIKHLNIWRSFLPNAMYVNLYGPTEITCNCLYYIINRDYSDDELLPLGGAFPNTEVFLLNEKNEKVTAPNILGEICVSGNCLALGYYADEARTAQSFVQNPLNGNYRNLIYRTGDLAQFNANGELFYASRKDFQIKHMGHRIELGEIEHAMQILNGVNRACCLFWEEKQRIIAFYDGNANKKDVLLALRETLPTFMLPNAIIPLEQLPITDNGKINRTILRSEHLKV